MLPLVTILTLTAIKDGIEDWRRNTLDNGVNNSAVTRLGDWQNVNRPVTTRRWWHIFGGGSAQRVSKGVKRLRQKEGSYDAGFLYAEGSDMPKESRETLSTIPPSPTLAKSGHDYPPSRLRSDTIDTSNSFAASKSSSSRKSDVVSYNHATPGTAKWERTLWKKLEVGDIVLLKENDQIPADIVVLSSSDPEGVCFVETKNLDGETNLKPRKSLKATMGIGNEEDVEHARFWIDAEAPNPNLYSFNAVLKYQSAEEDLGTEHPIVEGKILDNGGEKVEPVTINELLLRGCALRNTTWVIGLVIFTGADTKIMLNQGSSFVLYSYYTC